MYVIEGVLVIFGLLFTTDSFSYRSYRRDGYVICIIFSPVHRRHVIMSDDKLKKNIVSLRKQECDIRKNINKHILYTTL